MFHQIHARRVELKCPVPRATRICIDSAVAVCVSCFVHVLDAAELGFLFGTLSTFSTTGVPTQLLYATLTAIGEWTIFSQWIVFARQAFVPALLPVPLDECGLIVVVDRQATIVRLFATLVTGTTVKDVHHVSHAKNAHVPETLSSGLESIGMATAKGSPRIQKLSCTGSFRFATQRRSNGPPCGKHAAWSQNFALDLSVSRSSTLKKRDGMRKDWVFRQSRAWSALLGLYVRCAVRTNTSQMMQSLYVSHRGSGSFLAWSASSRLLKTSSMFQEWPSSSRFRGNGDACLVYRGTV